MFQFQQPTPASPEDLRFVLEFSIVGPLKGKFGVCSIEELFKRCFINGCGSEDLNPEEAGIVARDVTAYYARGLLPPYVRSAFARMREPRR